MRFKNKGLSHCFIYMVCSIPPELTILEFMRTLKEKSAIMLSKTYPRLKQKPY